MTSKEVFAVTSHATDFFLGFEQPRSGPVSDLVAALATLDVPYDVSHRRKARLVVWVVKRVRRSNVPRP